MTDSITKVRKNTSEEEKFDDILNWSRKTLEHKADHHDVSVSENSVELVQSFMAEKILEFSNSTDVEGDIDYWVDQIWGDFGDYKSTQAHSDITFAIGSLSEESEELRQIMLKEFAYSKNL